MPNFNFNCNCDDGAQVATLKNIRDRVMIRLGYAAQVDNPPPGMEVLLNSFIQGAQETIHSKYPGRRLSRLFSWLMTAGERYYGIADNDQQDPYNSFPCTKLLDPQHIEWVGFYDLNNTWTPLVHGIRPELYTRANITPGWPAFYEVRQCIEVFPAPQAAYTLVVKGSFGLLPFAEDTDVCTVDSEIIFNLALSDAKAHYRQPDADRYAARAAAMLGDQVAGDHQTARYIPGQRSEIPEPPPIFLPLVP